MQISRRESLLGIVAAGSIAAVPVVAATAQNRSISRDGWNALRARYEEAVARKEAFCREVYDPAESAWFEACGPEPKPTYTYDHDGKEVTIPVNRKASTIKVSDELVYPAAAAMFAAYDAQRNDLWKVHRLDEIDARYNEMMDGISELEDRLMEAPAPNTAALAYKLRLLADREIEDWLQLCIADAERHSSGKA